MLVDSCRPKVPNTYVYIYLTCVLVPLHLPLRPTENDISEFAENSLKGLQYIAHRAVF